MLGWLIIIRQKSPEECDKEAAIFDQGLLARWEVGLYGLTWLDELVKAGRAEQILYNGGYPMRYRALAKDVLPLFVEGHPPYKPSNTIGEGHFHTGAWVRELQINKEKIAQCPADFLLTIDAWDLS